MVLFLSPDLIHFELILVQGVRFMSISVFFLWLTKFSNLFVEILSFLYFCLCQISNGHICAVLFFHSLSRCIDLCVYPSANTTLHFCNFTVSLKIQWWIPLCSFLKINCFLHSSSLVHPYKFQNWLVNSYKNSCWKFIGIGVKSTDLELNLQILGGKLIALLW